jgi:hypothetical protein
MIVAIEMLKDGCYRQATVIVAMERLYNSCYG